VNNRIADMKIEFDDSCICLLDASDLNCKETVFVFALKNMMFDISLIDIVELFIIKYMTIDNFTSFCNNCKDIIKSDHDEQ